MPLDLTHGHAPGIERENLVVEPLQAPLALLDQLRREIPVPIAWNPDRQGPGLRFDSLGAMAVAPVIAGRRAVERITQMVGQLRPQGALNQR